MKEKVLTMEQRLFAAEHHNLIYSFLNYKQLAEDDYYDIVVFGYLDAVRRYCSLDDLQRYNFSTIAWRAMQRSLDTLVRDGVEHLFLVGNGFDLESHFAATEAAAILLESAERLVPGSFTILSMKAAGYSEREISRRLKTPVDEIKDKLSALGEAMLNECYG